MVGDKLRFDSLTAEEKDSLILELVARIEMLEARLLELEEKLSEKKTSKNSGIPPSRDKKRNLPGGKKKGRRQKSMGRKGYARDLHPDPDEILDSKLKKCSQCVGSLEEEDHQLHTEYDKIEIPPIKPKVTRVRLYASTCKTCGVTHKAPAPQGFEEGSPFSRSVEEILTYMRYGHHIGYKRLIPKYPLTYLGSQSAREPLRTCLSALMYDLIPMCKPSLRGFSLLGLYAQTRQVLE